MFLEVRKLISRSPLVLGEGVEVDHCAVPEGYAVHAEVFSTHWSEFLGRSIEIFECPLCRDYDFVANGEGLHRHRCGALLALQRLRPRDDVPLPGGLEP